MHSFLHHPSYPLPLPIAHRGYSANYPENTMAAFSAAVDLGYKCLETDVHATADGRLVAFHDPDLNRVASVEGRIDTMKWDDLKKIKVKGKEPIPLFEEVLSSWPDTRFIIDPKEDSATKPLYDVLVANDAWDRVCVGSFSDQRLAWIRSEAGSKLCTSMGPREVFRLRLNSWGIPLGRFGANCVQAPLRDKGVRILDRSFINKAHSYGFPVQAWTINDVETMGKLLDLGIDAIMSDEAELMKKFFQKRGIWWD
ncbi:MAG: glycerophosphodiester phosphodiesterase [Rhodobacteraceae bacterium]|nr:glycerophosphodiester phosphodiesterase [Paracoccaceae bacterium]